MALFDSIVEETGEKFDLTSDQAKALLSALLGLMTDSATGGFGGLIRRFRSADSGETSSLQAFSSKAPHSKEQIESSLGAETIAALADRAGLDYATTVSALTFLLPQTVERLTPNGKIPDEQTLRAAAEDLMRDSNEPTLLGNNAASAASTEAFDRIGNATEDIAGKKSNMMSGNRIDDPAAVGDRFSAGAAIYEHRLDEKHPAEFNDDSPLKWLAPLIILALLVAAGFWFCGKSSGTAHAGVNAGFNISNATTDRLNRATSDAGLIGTPHKL